MARKIKKTEASKVFVPLFPPQIEWLQNHAGLIEAGIWVLGNWLQIAFAKHPVSNCSRESLKKTFYPFPYPFLLCNRGSLVCIRQFPDGPYINDFLVFIEMAN